MYRLTPLSALLLTFCLLAACSGDDHGVVAKEYRASAHSGEDLQACAIELIVLGIAQDAGIPQIGQSDDPG